MISAAPPRFSASSGQYPSRTADRTAWILGHRGAKNQLDPWKPYAFLWEDETGESGDLIPTATIFLTNTECPYRCLMCDLWKNTLDSPTPVGSIPAQITYALERLCPARQIKLYNSGNFFDPRAIPPSDYSVITRLVERFERVIVECHPALLSKRALQFQDMIPGRLEVAIGLETVHPGVLDKLNKRFTLDDFRRAADFLAANRMDLRVFILVRSPFMTEQEGVDWACRSIEFAFECGTKVCTVIPTRGGNGAMEKLASIGDFMPPELRSLETTQEYGLNLRRGRVFSDTWDIEKFYTCACSPRRASRLAEMNRTQRVPTPVECLNCGGERGA